MACRRERFDRRSLFARAAAAAALSLDARAAARARASDAANRTERAIQIRLDAAHELRGRAQPRHARNGDEDRFAPGVCSYTKGLPHTYRGDVGPAAYAALLTALESGRPADFERIPLGKVGRFVNPQAAFAYVLEGPDPHQIAVPPPPSFDSAETAAEMLELYWQALTRDVPFTEYESHPLTAAAANELSNAGAFRGPREAGRVTPATLFRGLTRGDASGPYVSQFLWLDVPYGALTVPHRFRSARPGVDYLFTFDRWLSVQNGDVSGRVTREPVPRYIRTARDLADYVHHDFSFQAFLNAALILLGPAEAGKSLTMDHGNPYYASRTQAPFGTFGEPHVLDVVARVAASALKACWFQKWLVHRRLRPEEFGGRVHLQRAGRREYAIHPGLFEASAIDRIAARHGTALLTQAYPEGAPLHPAYPGGHAAVAGACVTVLKAFFDESLPMPGPVVPGADGASLLPYTGSALLTVGGELDKLAFNMSMGRNAAGLHWRSDIAAGLALGEDVALGTLADMKRCFNEDAATLSLTRFDGTRVAV